MTTTRAFLGSPYDWLRPTVTRLKQRRWNPGYGWGYDVNLARLLRRSPSR